MRLEEGIGLQQHAGGDGQQLEGCAPDLSSQPDPRITDCALQAADYIKDPRTPFRYL